MNGPAAGKSALLLAGNHGDEYETEIALMKLAREVDPARCVAARVCEVIRIHRPPTDHRQAALTAVAVRTYCARPAAACGAWRRGGHCALRAVLEGFAAPTCR